MSKKEAAARLKINSLLEESDWRLLDKDGKRANVEVETKISSGKKTEAHELGDDFENAGGFADYVLYDNNHRPIAVLEAKRESIAPLSAKEQARDYANSLHVRYVILSNGNVHFLWDMQEGNPEPISKFPTLESLQESKKFQPNTYALINENVDVNYIAKSQMPDFEQTPEYRQGGDALKEFLNRNKIKIMRKYQVEAVQAIQKSASKGNKRYLLEMATGTGKTLTCAAIIKLFLRTGNTKRVLFLVDRIELENQAQTALEGAIGSDYTILTYKHNKDDWGKADVLISTVQSLLSNNRYRELFSPTDFDLVISDEAHRSISGNARAVFEYFIGYRVGLTATPKNYLKGWDSDENTEREFERRQLLDTYATFGCESGQPTYSYSLIDGVNDPDGPFLVNPIIVDARTEITTQLLSDKGYAIHKTTEDDIEVDAIFGAKDFEKKFFNEATNQVFAKSFLQHADTDPISGEIGKSIIFAVSQNHASKIVNILNHLAMEFWPGKYQSDFAIQITSVIPDAQKYTTQFSENNLRGTTRWLDNYKSSRARVAVTVGMMTTGYDCSDLQNVVFMRPVFSPSDFIQMKGRGTRLYTFEYIDYANSENVIKVEKKSFKLIDFFAVCEYFNEKYDYDVPLELPKLNLPVQIYTAPGTVGTITTGESALVDIDELDRLKSAITTPVGREGMLVDQEMFRRFVADAQSDEELIKRDETSRDSAKEYLKNRILDRPEYYMTLDKIRRYFKLDRKITLGEALDIIMGRIETPKTKKTLIEESFSDFVDIRGLSERLSEDTDLFYRAFKLFDAYISSDAVREAISSQEYGRLEDSNQVSMEDIEILHQAGLFEPIVNYVRDYVDIEKLKG